jgi:hypothetical protein
LSYVTWTRGCRVLRVRVPEDATVITETGGRKCCASALFVVEDVTADLLLLKNTPFSIGGRTAYTGIDVDGNLCGVHRNAVGRQKWWGPTYARTKQIWQLSDPDGRVYMNNRLLETGSDEYRAAVDMLDRIEPFEEDCPSKEAV